MTDLSSHLSSSLTALGEQALELASDLSEAGAVHIPSSSTRGSTQGIPPLERNTAFAYRAIQNDSFKDALIQDFPSFSTYSSDYSQPSFSYDYIEKPYADILDVIATILILKCLADSFICLKSFIYRGQTQSLAIQYMFDRFYANSIPSIIHFRHISYSKPKFRLMSNFPLRLIAALLFLLLAALDLALIFSQRRVDQWRGIENLYLRTMSLKSGHPDGPVNSNITPSVGCSPIVKEKIGYSKIPIYFCNDIFAHLHHKPIDRTGVSYIFESTEHFFISSHIDPGSEYQIVFREWIEVRDETSEVAYFVNLMRIGYAMNSEKLTWVKERIARLCEFKIDRINTSVLNSRVSMMRIEFGNSSRISHENNCTRLYLLGTLFRMIIVTDQAYTRADFNRNPDTIRVLDSDAGEDGLNSSDPLDKLTVGSLKRISGITLWVFLFGCFILNIVVQRISWDIDHAVDELIGRSLELNPGDSVITDGTNRRFDVLDEAKMLSEEEDCTLQSGIRQRVLVSEY